MTTTKERSSVMSLVLDNEAVQALIDPAHAKHRRVMAHLAGVVGRRRRGARGGVMVPTSVRVEAGWDRSAPAAAALNRFRIVDHGLDPHAADVAAGILRSLGVSVADAHLGVVVRSLPGDVVVLTSDPDDVLRVSAPARITVVRV